MRPGDLVKLKPSRGSFIVLTRFTGGGWMSGGEVGKVHRDELCLVIAESHAPGGDDELLVLTERNALGWQFKRVFCETG